MITKAQIDEFFKSTNVAVVGVSRNPKKFGCVVFQTLLDKKKYVLYPINPNVEEIGENKCYHDIMSLPADTNGIVILTRKDKTAAVVQQAVDKGIRQIWIQQHCDTPEALKIAGDKGANVIHGKCIMMFAEPVIGFHKFHRSLMGFFGRLPK
jgi:predicted CoA-binding protein